MHGEVAKTGPNPGPPSRTCPSTWLIVAHGSRCCLVPGAGPEEPAAEKAEERPADTDEPKEKGDGEGPEMKKGNLRGIHRPERAGTSVQDARRVSFRAALSVVSPRGDSGSLESF